MPHYSYHGCPICWGDDCNVKTEVAALDRSTRQFRVTYGPNEHCPLCAERRRREAAEAKVAELLAGLKAVWRHFSKLYWREKLERATIASRRIK